MKIHAYCIGTVLAFMLQAAQAVECTVVEFIPCPPISAYSCLELFSSCEADSQGVMKCTTPELDDFGGNAYNGVRAANPGESGSNAVTQIGTVNCYQERACAGDCEQIPVFGWWRCQTAPLTPPSPWIPGGDTYLALQGTGTCEGEYGYPGY